MSRLRVAAVALVTAVLAPLTGMSPVAAASPLVIGNDYSWPQCPKGVGNGQGAPLLKGVHAFAVVGLTDGVAMHENPCLASQWRYARTHARWLTGYTMATYPSRGELRAASSGHFGACTTTACRLRTYGWAQGAFADQSLRRVGAHPPLVWVDVEPRPKHPWSSSRSRNSVVLKALIDSLHAHGYGVGIYSNARMWRQIAGFRIRLPEWVPNGSLTGGCRLSFAGGHVALSQWTHIYRGGRAYDENLRCAGMPSVTSWWQRAAPTVTAGRNVSSGSAYARFDARPPIALDSKDPAAPAVVTVPSTAGPVPLFVSVTATGVLRARTLGSQWLSLGPSTCRPGAVPSVTAGGLSVRCTTTDGADVVTTVPLDAAGAPRQEVVAAR